MFMTKMHIAWVENAFVYLDSLVNRRIVAENVNQIRNARQIKFALNKDAEILAADFEA